MNTSATNLNPILQPHPSNQRAQAISNPNNNGNASSSSTTTNNTTTTSTANATTNGSLSDSLASTDGYRTPNVDNSNQSAASHQHHNNNNNNHHHHPHHQLSKTNLYIRGLQSSTSDQDLYNMCSRFGDITSTKAILDKANGCCRGYGFVEFSKPQAAEVAVQELTKSGIQAQMAKITSLYSSHHHHQQHHHHHHHNHHHHNNSSSNNNNNNNNNHNNSSNSSGGSAGAAGGGGGGAHSNNQQQQQHQNQNPSSSNNSSNNNADPTNLYIANLPPNMSEEELENLLSTYGHVVSTRILRDQSNIPRGVGFARMESKDKCEQIIEQLNGRPCKGWKEPLLVKYADGGNKKRHHHNNQHQHHNNNHHQHHKVHQEDNRWRDSSTTSDLGSVSSFDHQSNISHSNHLSDLTMMSALGYPRMQHGFPPTVAAGAPYPASMGPPTSAPQWIHPGGPGQPYVIPQQMIQAGGLAQSNQAAAAAMHYGHIPQLTSQMQSLQLAHPGAPVGGYLPPQHQWGALWTHPMAGPPPQQQPQPSMRIPSMQPLPPSQQQSPQTTPVQQSQQQQQQQQPPPIPQQQPSASDAKIQVSTMPL